MVKNQSTNPVFPLPILVDDREKSPFTFEKIKADKQDGEGYLAIATQATHLATGDYSLLGYESKIAIERKSKADLWSTISQHRLRFVAELQRLADFQVAAIVVESSWEEAILPPPYTKFPAKSLFRSILSWIQHYPAVQWHFLSSRRFAEIFTFRMLERFLRNEAEMTKQDTKQNRQLSSFASTSESSRIYSDEELSFLKAMDNLRRRLRRFPTHTEILREMKTLGWRLIHDQAGDTTECTTISESGQPQPTASK